MRAHTIRVQLSDMDKLAELLCEIDFELAENNSNKILKILVENAHETISNMLGKHKSEVYKKDEEKE